MNSINALEALTRIKERLHDTGHRAFSENESFRAMDDVLRTLYGRVRSTGEYHGLDRLDVTPAQFTALETDVLEFDLPEYVGDVQMIEVIQQLGVPAFPLKQASLEDMNASRGVFSADDRRWLWSRYGNAGSIQIRGRAGSAIVYRIWFVHTWGPLHYSTVASGTTTTITVGVPVGAYKNRPNLYDGMQLEILADVTQPTNVGAVRRISSFTGGVHTLQTALPAAANSTTTYALLIPLPPEDHAYFVEECAVELLRRAGNNEEVAIHEPYREHLEAEFIANIHSRATGEPGRFVSSRMFR